MKYYEDINIGDKVTTPGKTITDTIVTTVVALAGYTEPIFHDEEFAKKTPFGGRVAPGLLTVMVAGALAEQADYWQGSTIGLVGLDNIKFLGAVKPGDTIQVEMEVFAKKESSKPDRGLVWDRKTILNQRGEAVAVADHIHLCKRRPKG
ncbi:MAG: MaoC family dehydratase N-terminal domain-containing protein [Chloroflexi bacterium]|nr:MaoC family dehydratase N-terminal domain-containing protein [Chloroflexota bacterium]